MKAESLKNEEDCIGDGRPASGRTLSDCSGSARRGMDRAGTERAGTERARTERAGMDRAGTDRAGTERAGMDRAGTARTAENARGWSVAFALTLLLGLTVSLTPFYSDVIRGGVMQAFSFVCHQLPSRSPHVGGVQLAVCHRCMGIYWALPAAALVFGLSRGLRFVTRYRTMTIVVLAGIPAGIDWMGDILGFWVNTPSSRWVTGAIFGLVAGYLLTEGISDIVRESRSKKGGTPRGKQPGS